METEKIGFFKRVLISIKDFEKYDIFAMEKWQSSIKYLFIITLIFSFIFTILYSYKILTGGLDDLINQVDVNISEELNMSSTEMQEIVQQNYAVFFIVIFFPSSCPNLNCTPKFSKIFIILSIIFLSNLKSGIP